MAAQSYIGVGCCVLGWERNAAEPRTEVNTIKTLTVDHQQAPLVLATSWRALYTSLQLCPSVFLVLHAAKGLAALSAESLLCSNDTRLVPPLTTAAVQKFVPNAAT